MKEGRPRKKNGSKMRGMNHLRKQAEKKIASTTGGSRDMSVPKNSRSSIMDTSDFAQAETSLRERLDFEKILSTISARFVDLPFDRIDEEIHVALRDILAFFKVDRCGMLEVFTDKTIWRITHVAASDDAPPVPLGARLSIIETNPWAYNKLIEKREVLNVSNLDDLPAEASLDKETWIGWGIRSNLNIPIIIGESVAYIFYLNSIKGECVWQQEIIPRLRLLGEIFVSAIERIRIQQHIDDQLRFESLLADLSAKFVQVTADKLEREIEEAMKMVLEFFQVDRCGLILAAKDRTSWRVTHIAYANDQIQRVPTGSDLPRSLHPWSYKMLFERGQTVTFSNTDDLPPEAEVDRQSWIKRGIRSALFIPIRISESIDYAMAINSSKEENIALEQFAPRLRLLGEIFVNALARKHADEVLLESEARLSLATEAVGAGLWSMDVDTKRVWVSPKSRELFHFAPDEEITYESYSRVIHPDDRERVNEDVQRVIGSGEALGCEYRIVLPDGDIRWIVARGKRVLRSTGEPDRLTGLSFDITERKKIDWQLAESQILLSSLINSTSDMIWSVDAEHFGILTFNRSLYDRFLHAYGIKLKGGERPEDLFSSQDYVQQWHTLYRRALEEGSFTTEYKAYAEGRIIRLNFNILKRNDVVFGISVFSEDITERKKMELQLTESQTLLSSLVNSTPDMIWSVDAEHFGLLTFNRSLTEYFLHEHGISIKEGMRPEDLLPADYAQQWHMFYKQALEKGSFTTEYSTSGGNHALQLNINSLRRGDRAFGISVFAQDITERKKMEAQLREQLAEIEKLKTQLEEENIYLREEIKTELGFGKIIGSSDALKYVLFRAQQVASTDATVLILGETGTGKGMVAYAIHEMSTRGDKPMVTVNCAALPANLIESELFGREKGAFTGAHAKQVGRFEVADGGTIFLDEIGELPLELQAKLLRVLQDGEFERLGSPKTIKVDVRVIASTSRDLKAETRTGRFRQDLYYRLNVFPVSLPPLRARVEDIPDLANYFIDKYAKKFGRRFEAIAKDTMQTLKAYHWPGNVRELEHVIERAVIISPAPVFRLVDHLEQEPVKVEEGTLKEFQELARDHILQVLQKTRWKIDGEGGAAAMLGLNPSTLRFRIKKLGIKRP